MKHLGDITKISGYDAPTVDVIVGGSPCQDLSIAGKRAGLDGERSGLFMEQIRIIKEMREKDVQCGRTDVDIRPRYMVWENVPGAFSSNKGEDFRVVLEETAKVCDKDASIPMPNNGKWTTAGCILGDGWSIAWRVLDAQFWGVPQRRRRIALVADFGGHSAPEILFVRKSLSGDTEQSKPQRKATATDAAGCTGADDSIGVDVYNLKLTDDKACCLTSQDYTSTGTHPKVIQQSKMVQSSDDLIMCIENSTGRNTIFITEDVSPTLVADSHNHACFVPNTKNERDQGLDKAVYRKSKRGQSADDVTTWVEADVTNTLNTFDQGEARANELVVALDRASYNQGQNAQFDIGVDEKGIAQSLVAKGPGAVAYSINHQGGNIEQIIKEKAGTLTASINSSGNNKLSVAYGLPFKYTVRRLTPFECERLQGYPDGWTDIGEYIDTNGKKKQSSDTARYKALGNSIAIPPWKWVMKRLCACYERDATLASLFDGIGGFPLIWEQLNGKGSCLWASEIEEFPIAVTKMRIGG